MIPCSNEEAGQKERAIRRSEDGAGLSARRDGEDLTWGSRGLRGTLQVQGGLDLVTKWTPLVCVTRVITSRIRSRFLGSEAGEIVMPSLKTKRLGTRVSFLVSHLWQCCV